MAKNELMPLKKGKASFTLIGKAKINDYTFDLDHEYDSGWTSNNMNIGIDCGDGNVVYAEMSGGYFPAKYNRDNKVYVHGVKVDDNGKNVDDYENTFTIDWDDRNDSSILETIGKGCFITVGIEKDEKGNTFYKDFLTEYDAVQYLSEHLADETVVNVKGIISYETDGEKVYIKKKINNIALSKAESDKFKATFVQTILLDDGSIGKPDKEKNTIPMSVYVVDYIGKPKINGQKIEVKKNFAIPVNMEFGIGEKGAGTYPGQLPTKGVPLTGAWMYHYPSNKKITTKSGKRGWILRLDKGTKPLYRFFQGYAAKAPMYHTGENIKEYIKEQLVIDLNRGE